jgi:hypothetical protein
MYATIDAIQASNAPWKTITFWYNRPCPANLPKWMLETYELCTCNSHLVLHQQLATTDFTDNPNTTQTLEYTKDKYNAWVRGTRALS